MTDAFDPFAAGDFEDPGDEAVAVDLEFATVRHFREEMAPYLGERGFFARTERPFPINTPVRFRFVLPEGFVLAEGRAVVAWIIEPEAHPDLIPGMALRFVAVEDQSRSVIMELVDFHIATGGDPFDVGPARDDSADIPTDALEGSPETPREPSIQPEPSAEDDAGGGAAEDQPASSDEVLPDWLLEASGRSAAAGTRPATDEAAGAEARATGGHDREDPADLEIDLLGDSASDPSPFEDGAAAARATPGAPPRLESRNQPRDLRLGLLIAAVLAVVAVAVLAWSLWVRPWRSQQPVVDDVRAAEETADAPLEAGVELLEDAADEASEGAAKEMVSEAGPEAPAVLPVTPVPQAPPSDEEAGGPATRVADVVAAARPGETSIVIRGNGVFADDALGIVRLADPPRIWMRVRRIETFYRPNEITVGSPEVVRVRIGHHPEESPPSLYVVLDVTDESVEVTERQVEGDTIRVTVRRP